MGATNSSNIHEDDQSQEDRVGQITATPNSIEAAAFVQSIFLQNEELAFIPLRLMSDGHRELNKAKANKTRAVDLPFELDAASMALKLVPGEASKWSLQFLVDTKVVSKVVIYIGAKEQRSENKYNTVSAIVSEQQIEVQLPERKNKQRVQTAINLDSILSSAETSQELAEHHYPILITLVSLQSQGHSREVSQSYYYFDVVQSLESCSTVLLKKGSRG